MDRVGFKTPKKRRLSVGSETYEGESSKRIQHSTLAVQSQWHKPKAIALSEREVLDKLMPELVQYTNPLILLPYLQRHQLVNPDNAERINQPTKIDRERTQIIVDNVAKNPEGLYDFIQCLQEEPDHPGHSYLAGRLWDAITDSNQQWKEKAFWHMDGLALHRRDQVPSYRKLLGRIAQELTLDEIRYMAFLANHIARLETLSKITDGWELFAVLETHGLLSSSNFMFLFDSLITIQRPDLVKEVAQELWAVPYAHPVFRVMEHLHQEPSQEDHSHLKRCFNSYTEAMRKLTSLADDEKLWEKRFSNTFEIIRTRLHSRPTVTAASVQTPKIAVHVSTLETVCQHCNQLIHGMFIKFIPTQNPQNIREPIEQWQQFYSELEDVWDTLEWEKEERSKEHIKRREGGSHPIGKAMTEAYKSLIELAQGMLCEMAVEEESEKLSEILRLIERMIYLAVNQLLYFVVPWLSSIIYLTGLPRAEMAPFRRRLQDTYDKNEAEVKRMKTENQAQSESIQAVDLVSTMWQMTLNSLIKNSEHDSVTTDCQTLFAKSLESEKRAFYNIYILVAKKCADTARTSLDQFKEERIDDLVKNVENETGREILRNAIRNSLRYDRLK